MLKDLKRFGMAVDLCLKLGYSPEQLNDYLSQKCKPFEFERYTIILQDHLQGSTRSTKDHASSFNLTRERVQQICYNGFRKICLAVNEKDPNIKVFF